MNALLVSHPCETLGVQLRASMPVPCQREVDLTARHKLLLCCFLLAICPPFLYYKLFCRQDGGIVTPTSRPAPPFQKPHYPLPCTITLASPRKRGGGTADIIFWLTVQYSDSPAFTILKLFRAVTVGIALHPHHQ